MSVVAKEGALRKKGSHMSIWGTRYFVLRGSTLLYYSHSTDTESKGRYYLKKNCRITPVREEDYKRKKQYIFSILFPVDSTSSSGSARWREKVPESSTGKKKGLLKGDKVGEKDRETSAGKSGAMKEIRDREVVLAADTAYDAQGWVQALENQIAVAASDSASGTVKEHGNKSVSYKMNGNEVSSALSGDGGRSTRVPPSTRVKTVSDWIRRVEWTLDESRGCFDSTLRRERTRQIGAIVVDLRWVHVLRVNLTVSGSSTEVLKTVLSMPSLCMNGPIQGLRVVEKLDTYIDIIHLTLREVYIEPTMSSSRDFCLLRYWKQMSDGSYVVCLDSTFHQDCPVVTGCVRGDMHAAYVISPPRVEGGGTGEGGVCGDNETDFGVPITSSRKSVC